MGRATGAAPFAAGAIIGKRYRLRRLLGEGSMGVVWEAVQLATGRPAALKLVVRPEPELRRRLLREAPVWMALQAESHVTLLDYGETGSGDPFFVMDMLRGEALAARLARELAGAGAQTSPPGEPHDGPLPRRGPTSGARPSSPGEPHDGPLPRRGPTSGARPSSPGEPHDGPLPQREAAAIGRDVARALGAVHAEGLVHRAVRPSSVFLHHLDDGTPVVRLLDLGMTRDLGAARRHAPDGPLPAPWTWSPEQVRAGAPPDGRSDVWSLGAVLYEMLAGARPFEGDTDAVLRQIAASDPPDVRHRVRGLHPALGGLVMACLRRQPEERPWPAQEIALRLEPFASAHHGSLPPLAIPLGPPGAGL